MSTARAAIATLGIAAGFVLPASAAVVAYEAELDDIFGPQNFPAGTFIDISFNPVQTTVGLSDVRSRSDLLTVMALVPNSFPAVNLYLVDNIDWCGFIGNDITGCSSTMRTATVLELRGLESTMIAELIAHELGHVLDLRHVDGDPNLMSPPLNGNTSLTPEQIATINASPVVQGLDPNRFIRINPIVVQPVPEPVVALYLLLAGSLLARRCRRGTWVSDPTRRVSSPK